MLITKVQDPKWFIARLPLAVFSSFLIKTHKEVYPKIEFDYECIFRCEKCAFVKKDG